MTQLAPGIDAVLALVQQRAGLVFPPSRVAIATSAIAEAMRGAGIADQHAYVHRLRDDDALLDELLADLTVGESYFFREPAQFDFVRREVLPGLAARRSVRAWSAGCSTGEEAYSLAILLRERGLDAQVVGTDVSRHRLAHARRGQYRPWSLRGVPADVVARHFRERGGEYRLAAELRGAVDFRYLNLASEHYPAATSGIWGMDLVLCRNVLIYFDRDTIAHVAARLLSTLADDGWLLLGASDPPLADFVACETVLTGGGMAYRRAHDRAVLPRRTANAPAIVSAMRSAATSATASALQPPAVAPAPQRAEPTSRAPDPAPDAPPATRLTDIDAREAIADAYRAHAYDRVVELVAQLPGGTPVDERTWVHHVRALANLGRMPDAGRACAAALDLHRSTAELHCLHAILLVAGDMAEQGVEAARRALYLDRDLVVAHVTLGQALARIGQRAQAARSFENAERLLDRLSPDAPVPAADGEPAARLLQLARAQRGLLQQGAA